MLFRRACEEASSAMYMTYQAVYRESNLSFSYDVSKF